MRSFTPSLGRNLFPTHPISGLLGFLGRSSHLVPNSGLRRLLSDQLEFARLEDAPIPFHVVATDVISGTDVLLSSGDAVDAIAASAAIPGIFPPVNINGRDLMDGGVVNNTRCHTLLRSAPTESGCCRLATRATYPHRHSPR